MNQVTNCNFGTVRQEITFPIDEFENAPESELIKNTFLLAEGERRISLSRFQPPKNDRLGAKFYFARFQLNGLPSVTDEDEVLQFETRIQGKEVTAKFNLKEMLYKDKLEI